MNAATRLTRFGSPLVALALLAIPALSLRAQQYGQQQQGPPPNQGYGQPQGQGYGQQQGQGYGPPPGQGYGPGQGGGWDAPPNEFSDMGRRGFHDGIEAARYDFSQRRPLNFQRNPQFRHPPAPGPLRNDYRNGFQRGYERASDHLMHQGPPPQGGGYPR